MVAGLAVRNDAREQAPPTSLAAAIRCHGVDHRSFEIRRRTLELAEFVPAQGGDKRVLDEFIGVDVAVSDHGGEPAQLRIEMLEEREVGRSSRFGSLR